MMNNLAYLLVDKSRLVRRRFDDSVRDHELTGPQARLVLLVDRQPLARQSFYAEELEVEPITLCRMVDRLEERGWLARQPDPADRRAWLLSPTAKCHDTADELRNSLEGLLDDLLEPLDAEERTQLASLLSKIGNSDMQSAQVAHG
ncbi:MAG: MarR family transcriptional regulator [Novosphingobium sp.]|nr:MarR family transcriptional regulator [Novosphingobium sp.]